VRRVQVCLCTQDKTDRERATNFISTIKKGTPLASKGAIDDSTSGNEPLWLSIAKDVPQVAKAPFQAAGGTSTCATRTINTNWLCVSPCRPPPARAATVTVP
jgi:hypothetical protein